MDSHPPRARSLPQTPAVAVQTEREVRGGWSYDVLIAGRPHEVRLLWRDHDYWSGGASAPSRVVQALVEYLVAHPDWLAKGEALPRRFDAARVRRWLPQVDSELRGLI